ncbi:MAG: XdhC family protein [Armatimonadetes bacterium]|nr:XdhC family protein [Armatimonadota bacterium]
MEGKWTKIDMYEKIARILKEKRRAALATVIKTTGSTPQKVGAKMLVDERGTLFGTIGGGCVEAEIYAEARRVLRSGKARVHSFRLTSEKAAENGLVCGGIMEIFLEPLQNGSSPALP